ncbi:hypothetical protein QYF36_025880 [Acer negundo]|nr:hypothetical protein QYF36_025880 [Acer negundo]
MDIQPITVAFPVQKVKKLNKENLVDGKLYGLPDGWRVELRPRNGDYQGKVDQFFYAPGTNKQFRSIKSIEKQFNIKVEKPIINSLDDDKLTPDQGLKRDHSEAYQRSKPKSSQRAKKKCKFE